MKKNLLFLALLFSLSWSFSVSAQAIPGDSIVYGPMLSPVYNNKVRVWVLTKNNTGSGQALSIALTGAGTPSAPLTGVVHNQDERLGYSLRSFEYTNLQPGETYTANVLKNGLASGRTASIKNGANTVDDFEFLSGGCGRIYDLSRCIDQPESAFHVNGDPQIFNVMANEGSDMMVWLGDATYLLGLEHAMGQCPNGVDDWANKDMAFDRYMFYRKYHDNLLQAMPQLAITDNHDVGPNEFNKTMPTLAEMREIFMDWWPNPEYKSTPEGQGLFSSYKYKDVEYFLLDNRSYRDNTIKHLGPDQMAWLKTALLNSTASFKVLINGTPSFERNCGGRNFCASEQSVELINYIRDNNINGVLSLSADIHEQKFMIRDGDVKYPLYDVLSGNLNSDVGTGAYSINYGGNYLLTGIKQTYLRVNVYGEVGNRRMKVEYVGLNGQAYFGTVIHQDMLTSQDSDAHKLALNISNAVTDASTYNHAITATNYTFGADRDNVANEALHFSATTAVQLASDASLQMHDRPYSLAFWINPDSIDANGASVFSNATATTGVTFGMDAEGKLMYTDHATQQVYKSQYKLLPHTWSYVTWKYDNVKRSLSLYYNGQMIQNWNNVVSPAASTANIMIGNNFQSKKFLGLLDKVSLYGRLVSDQSITDEADFVTNRGSALKVTASSMAIPGATLNPILAESFTIEFWGKLAVSPGTNFKLLASNGRVNGNSTGISFEFPDSKRLNVVVGNNGSGWNNALSEKGDVWNIGEWNHVALSATKNGTMKYYINGILVGEAPFGQYIPNPNGLGFGYSPNYSGSVNGELDEVRIWNKALTADEILKDMHYPLTGTEEGLAINYDFNEYTGTGGGIMSKGTTQYQMQVNGATLVSGSAPVGEIAVEYQTSVKAKWSKKNDVAVKGLSLTEAITGYASNVVIGKKADDALAVVPGATDKFYLKGGWRIDPLNNPFATVKINLTESLVKKDSISNVAVQYLLFQQNDANEFITVADGSYDGENVTFNNTNLLDGVYYLGWKSGNFPVGRGGSMSLAGGHDVRIPRAAINPVLSAGFTMEFWTKFLQDPGNGEKLVSNNGRVNNNTTGLVLEIPDNNSITATFGTNTANWNSINSGTSLIVGEWNHIAVTAEPNQSIKLYINGELKATAPFGTFSPNDVWDFTLGKSINYGAESKTIMDEFRVWNRVKTQAEIKAQMHTIITAADDHLAYNLTFDQDNNGLAVNSGTIGGTIPYTAAPIIASTSPVSEVSEAFPDKISGNWSFANENTNGFYIKNAISSYTENVVVGRKNNNQLLSLGTATDKFYVAGGWHISPLNITTATVEIDLAKIFDDINPVTSLAENFSILKGDPAGSYTVVGTSTALDGKIVFENIALSTGDYYLSYKTDVNAAIGVQGGAINLAGGHEVYIPKEGVNAALAGSFTIEMWARLTQTASANTKLIGFSSYSDGTNRGWEMEFLGNQTLQTITGKGLNGGWNSLNSTTVWNLNEWNHTAVTFVPNGEFKFYINGELMSSMAVATFYPGIYNLALGKNIANNAESKVSIDELRIWNKAKTIDEIRADMNLTITEPTANLVYNYTFNQDNSGFLLNSGSENVEVPYTNANIIPATSPVRNIEAPYRNMVTGNWSVKNDNKNGLYVQDDIENVNNNLVTGKKAGGEVVAVPGATDLTMKYLNSGWILDPLFLNNASLKVDLTKVFTNLNDVNLLASEYFLLKANASQQLEVIATGSKATNIVTFSSIELNDSEVVYLAWKNELIYPIGTFPIAKESIWKFNDKGVDLGTDWKNSIYDDSTWLFGNGILGYGDSVENTTLSYGTDAANKYPTYYFRNTFEVADASIIGNLVFNTLKDDGVVVYVNGTEAFRSNMPDGTIAYSTYAPTAIGGADETTYQQVETANLLHDGVNVIAVELHQASANSSDLGFDMEVNYKLPPIAAATYPMPQGSEWYYLDNGTSLDGTAWGTPAAVNENWARGIAPLGYGDTVKTVISYGSNSASKYITSYFYKDITIDTATIGDVVQFGLKRDDGAVVYVNGVEAFRDNMPTGAVTSLTNALVTVDGVDENRYFTFNLPKSIFQDGVNRIAVEMHNVTGQSSDIGFDLYIRDAGAGVSCDAPHIGCFTSIMPTGQTPKLIIAQEHRFQMLFRQGETYMLANSGTVPGNHDFAPFIATNGSSEVGHLSVNHENTPGGVSILDLHLDSATALWIKDFTQPVDLYNNNLVTTTRNCSGGITQWGTVITAEESTDNADLNGDGYQDVGWLVEIDPVTAKVKDYGNGKQEKLWAMGRMNHENVIIKSDQRTAYYGEDGGTHCVYKFVADVAGNLTAGTVYVLKLDLGLTNDEPNSGNATWVQVPNQTISDRNNLNTIAATLGGTNFNGVEDCDISPLDGKVYFTSKGKGRIYRFTDNGDTVSGFETFIGGKSYPITTPNGTVVQEAWGGGNDNLTFDEKGNLWVCQDGDNNYIWVIRPDHTQSSPDVKLFASMPAGSEPTGLNFTPDHKYGFFSVQHPNGDNQPQKDATFADVNFNTSSTVVFSLGKDLGLQAPLADFTANDVTVNEGETVTFTDLSTNHPTAWQWTFEGGTPAVSTEESPTVTYSTAGTYDVSLVTSNVAGTSPETKKVDYILVEVGLGTNIPNPLANIVTVYPNPTNGLVNIQLNDEAGKKVTVEVFDLLGRRIAQVPVTQTTGGSQKVVLNLSGFSDQMYIIQVQVGDKTGTYKLLKANK